MLQPRDACLTYGPEHKICASTVDLPTICIDSRDQSICVQWVGQPQDALPADVRIPPSAQFLFPLLVPKGDIHFTVAMESFVVPFLGQIKDWPANEETVRQMIDTVGKGDAEKWVVWFLNPSVKLEGHQMQSGCIGIALLGDPNCGVIEPQLFSDLSVRDRALRLF